MGTGSSQKKFTERSEGDYEPVPSKQTKDYMSYLEDEDLD